MVSKSREGWLEVGEGHRLYYVIEGKGYVPVVVVHGGPGACMNPAWCGFFNLQIFQLVFFDQRGCGRSTPYGSLEHNTIDRLVADMERLREHCGFRHWIVFGDSWGTTLGIVYGCTYPQHCLGFLLRGVFLGRLQDIEFSLWTSRYVYPEAHRHLLDLVEAATGTRPTTCDQMIQLSNQAMLHSHHAEDIAKAWAGYEALISTTEPDEASEDVEDVCDAVTMGRIECHYYLPGSIPDLLQQVRATPELTKLPCWIVHGRLDLVCPVTQAIDLHQAWPASVLTIVPGAGHYSFERGNRTAVFRCTDELERKFGPLSAG